MNISDRWQQFERLWNKKFGQQELDFEQQKLIEPPPQQRSQFDNLLEKALKYNPKKEDLNN